MMQSLPAIKHPQLSSLKIIHPEHWLWYIIMFLLALMSVTRVHAQVFQKNPERNKPIFSKRKYNKSGSTGWNDTASEKSSNNEKSDSVIDIVNQKARKRALQSALLPGLGQVNNDQVWKAPLVWAGLGLTVYFVIENNRRYQEFAKAYRLRTDGDSTTIDKFDPSDRADNSPPFYSSGGLRDGRETFRRNRTLSVISGIAVYLANVIDAYVFAHLQDFDVSDDLSMSVHPPRFANIAQQPALTTGITLKLKP